MRVRRCSHRPIVGAKLLGITAFCTDFLDGRPDSALLNGLADTEPTVTYGLLIRSSGFKSQGAHHKSPGQSIVAADKEPARRLYD
jgi:hypothetical protein